MTTNATTSATTTAKYELTDAQLDDMVSRVARAWNSESIRQAAREWFASLPVVSREAAERALGEATPEDVAAYWAGRDNDDYDDIRHGLDSMLAPRRAMLGLGLAPVVEPPKSEATPENVSHAVRRIDWSRGTIGPAAWATNVAAHIKKESAEASASAPAPQPAIDVAAELAKIRDDVESFRFANRTVNASHDMRLRFLEDAQDTHRSTMTHHGRRMDTQSDRIDDHESRIAALESTARRSGTRTGRSWWRWW